MADSSTTTLPTLVSIPIDLSDQPLPLWFVLRRELQPRGIAVPTELGVAVWRITADDVTDVERLRRRILGVTATNPATPASTATTTPSVSAAARAQASTPAPAFAAAPAMPGQTTSRVQSVMAPETPDEISVDDLVRGLNTLIEGPDNLSDWSGATAHPARLARSNRLYLEDVYPELRKVDETMLAQVYQDIHTLPEPVWALCLSGGGIRSATFSLGVLQGLAKAARLNAFHYLSTVSGGGYIGGWLSAWAARDPKHLSGVTDHLTRAPSSPLQPEPGPLYHLRRYTNYLSPRLGWFTADVWTLGATYLRNLLLTWVVLVPILMAVLLIPAIYAAMMQTGAIGVPVVAAEWLVTLLLGFGIMYLTWVRPGARPSQPPPATDSDPKRDDRAFVRFFLVPITLGAYLAAFLLRNDAGFVTSFVPRSARAIAIGWLLGVILRRRYDPGNKEVGTPQKKISRLARTHGRSLLDIPALAASLAAAYGILLWLYPHMENATNAHPWLYACLVPNALLLMVTIAGSIFMGATSRIAEDDDREWWARCTAWTMLVMVIGGGVTALVVMEASIIEFTRAHLATITPATLLTLGGTLFGAQSSSTPAGPSLRRIPLDQAVKVGTVLCSLVLIVLFAWGGAALYERLAEEIPTLSLLHPVLLWVCELVGLVLLGTLANLAIDANVFSLNGMYRNRLIRAYLGASQRSDERRPDRFTQFGLSDNMQMRDLEPVSQTTADGKTTPSAPLVVINMALNLAGSGNLAWQERKAESFTATPLFAGSAALGYRPMRLPDGRGYGGREGMSLGTAISISGAAASPNMGYHSSPMVTALMTLFNVRLGWWLGNPGAAGQDTFDRARPRLGAWPILAELMGRTSDQDAYVYLSDGGHFENLGLYEMILRRSKRIVVVDASCDVKFRFDDLGNTLRKIRIDLGVPVDFDVSPIPIGPKKRRSNAGQSNQGYYALGTIKYSCVDPVPAGKTADAVDGRVLYIKPAVYKTEPQDVVTYAALHPDFPHDSTTNQWYTESQFESYRALGAHVVDDIVTRFNWGTLR